MMSRLTAIDVEPLLLIGWQLLSPVTEPHILLAVALAIATATLVGLVVHEIRTRAQRVLLLGSGPLASMLADEIQTSANHRFSIVGVVDDVGDQAPVADKPELEPHTEHGDDRDDHQHHPNQEWNAVLGAEDDALVIYLKNLIETRREEGIDLGIPVCRRQSLGMRPE